MTYRKEKDVLKHYNYGHAKLNESRNFQEPVSILFTLSLWVWQLRALSIFLKNIILGI